MSYENAKLMNLEDGHLLLSVLDKRKADIISVSDTTAEPVKTFSDGADGLPMGLTVAVEPVQDLHGQENPWPGGATRNLYGGQNDEVFPLEIANGTTITVSCLRTSGTAYPAEIILYNADMSVSDTWGISETVSGERRKRTFTTASDIKYVKIRNRPDCTYTNAQIELGSTVTAYIPYSNVCPISGWTGANITRTGKNILWFTDGTDTSLNKRSCSISDNVVTVTGTGGVSSNVVVGGSNELLNGKYYPAGTYTFVQKVISNTTGVDISLRPIISDGTTTTTQEVGVPFTSAVPFKLQSISNSPQITWSSGMVVSFELALVQENDSTFEHYNGETYQITFPSEAGTVYGGTLTVNADGTGTLVVDKFLYVYDGTESFTKSGTALNGFLDNLLNMTPPHGWPNMANYTLLSITDERSSMFIPTRGATTYQNNYGYVYFDTGHNFNVPPETFGTTVDSFKAKLAELYAAGTPVSVFCKILHPLTYTLTDLDLVETLKGNNVLWVDTGDIKSVDYPADTKLYVNGKISEGMKLMALLLTANHEDGMKASKAYASGDLLTVGNTLYKATTSIANGATLTEGTNVTETTIAQELAALA